MFRTEVSEIAPRHSAENHTVVVEDSGKYRTSHVGRQKRSAVDTDTQAKPLTIVLEMGEKYQRLDQNCE